MRFLLRSAGAWALTALAMYLFILGLAATVGGVGIRTQDVPEIVGAGIACAALAGLLSLPSGIALYSWRVNRVDEAVLWGSLLGGASVAVPWVSGLVALCAIPALRRSGVGYVNLPTWWGLVGLLLFLPTGIMGGAFGAWLRWQDAPRAGAPPNSAEG